MNKIKWKRFILWKENKIQLLHVLFSRYTVFNFHINPINTAFYQYNLSKSSLTFIKNSFILACRINIIKAFIDNNKCKSLLGTNHRKGLNRKLGYAWNSKFLISQLKHYYLSASGIFKINFWKSFNERLEIKWRRFTFILSHWITKWHSLYISW